MLRNEQGIAACCDEDATQHGLQASLAGSNLMLLKPEIHKAFPTSEAVNAALATVLAIAEQTRSLVAKPKRVTKKRAAA